MVKIDKIIKEIEEEIEKVNKEIERCQRVKAFLLAEYNEAKKKGLMKALDIVKKGG